jgi:hypothetical protein
MRALVPLLTICSGIAIVIACVAESVPIASASETSAGTKIAAATRDAGTTEASAHKIVCSRNRPLQSSDVMKVASADASQGLNLASNIVQLFCRDVRINTIVVRDYCAVIRG